MKELCMTHRFCYFIFLAISTLIACNTAEDDPAGGGGDADADADTDAGTDPAEPDSEGMISCKEFFQEGVDFGAEIEEKLTVECQFEWTEEDAGSSEPAPDAGEDTMTEEEALAACEEQYYCRQENVSPRCELAQIHLMPKLYRCLLNLECQELEELGSFLATLEVAADMEVNQEFVDSLGKFPCKAPFINFINPNVPSGEFCTLQELSKQQRQCLGD